MAVLLGMTAIGLMFTAPNALRLLKKFDPDLGRKRNPGTRVRQAMKRLEGRGLVVGIEENGTTRFVLTEKGKRYAERLAEAESLHIPIPKRWDGRWRVVIFDIWERRREVRRQFRNMLKKIGFVLVQDSVWVYPYDCEEVIAFIRTHLRLGKGALYMIADGIEGDKKLREHFNLS